MKLTGPQIIVLASASGAGLIFRGEHNHICKELRRLGLVKYDPQPPPYPEHPNPVTAWRVTEAGYRMLAKDIPASAPMLAEQETKS